MTKRITVSLPDDVAAYLERSDNASATVAEALRALMNRGATAEAMLRAVGFNITEEGKARWRAKLKPFTAEQKAKNDQLRQLLEEGERKADKA